MIDIMAMTTRVLREELHIDEETTRALFDIGVMNEYTCKKMLIRREWERSMISRKTDLKYHLADRYCVSVSTVERCISSFPSLIDVKIKK